MAFVNETVTPHHAVSPLRGAEAIRAALKMIPTSPGVYRMLDAKGKVLYVGKAKNLSSRVTSYAAMRDLSTRILRMVEQVAGVEIIVTQNEAEALLVESANIKRLRPRYNILLKDDKSFPYLRIDTSHAFPRIEKHRGAQNKPGQYFGPFASVGALNETMALLQKIFLLRPCADTVFKNRTRPCLQYQIKRCSAPCVGYVDAADYTQQVTRARDFLKGRHRDVQDALAAEMATASAAMEYERAGHLRDRIRDLTRVQQEQGMGVQGMEDSDVIALACRGGRSVVQAVFFRRGVHFGNQFFHPRHEPEATQAEVMEGFITQFYETHTPPPEIYVNLLPGAQHATDSAALNDDGHASLALLEEALRLKAGYAVHIRAPQRGDKATLITNAAKNADAALAREELERTAAATHLANLQALLALPALPERIEVFDNSHTMGAQAIGAFIVATPEGFDKKSYRSFTIRDAGTEPGDDYAMMREMFRRHLTRIKKGDSPVPDLMLIDGGKGQLSAVMEVASALDMTHLNFVAIAKGVDRNAGREWFFMPGRDGFQLPPGDPTLHYLQRLRDEAHRFAIGRHRAKRTGALITSALDDIPGIGPGRKRALLHHFGSRADVEGATLDELAKVPGISRTMASIIYDYFHG
ncbi:MAG: excinuclease ABC subunit UvrC [Rickettsiales bacterium]